MSFAEIAAYFLAAALVLVLCRIFFKPLKSIFILGLNSLAGGIGIFIFNWALAPVGFSVGLNVATAAVCGMLGLPGLVLLILLKIIFAV